MRELARRLSVCRAVLRGDSVLYRVWLRGGVTVTCKRPSTIVECVATGADR